MGAHPNYRFVQGSVLDELEVDEPGAGPGFTWQLENLALGASCGLDVICEGILVGIPFVYPAEQLCAPVPVHGS